MKKQLYFIFALLLSISSFAQTFTVDGLKYNITSTTEPFTVEVGLNGFNSGVTTQTFFSGVANIPATVTHNGVQYAVTRIGSNAFQSCGNLTGVNIPNAVLSIGDYAFFGCTKLSSVTIPDSVTSLGNTVFRLSGLTAISIPNSITEIPDGAFRDCSKLASVLLPNTITSIGREAFLFCTALTNIDLPGTLTEIGNSAFSTSGLLSITVPEGVTVIKTNAFHDCRALTSVVLPASLTTLETRAFARCPALKSVTVNNPVPFSIDQRAFDIVEYINNDSSVRGYDITLKVPLGAESTYESTPLWQSFRGIDEQIAVGTIFMVDGINYSISNDTTFPTEANVASNPTFAGAANIPEVVSTGNNDFKIVGILPGAFANNTTLTSVSIPNSVKSIKQGNTFFGIPPAFLNCTSLTSITLGSGIEFIGQGTFDNCTALTSVTNLMQTPLPITADVFFNVPLANVTMRVPAGKIPVYEAAPVWKDFGTIASPQVNDVFTVDGIKYAITAISPALTVAVASNTTATGAVVIPTSVTNNGDTFAVTSIAAMAFKNAAITAVTIPNSITNIATEAFANCAALRVVTVNNTVPVAITAAVFTDTNISAATLNVPFGTAAAYEATAVWTDFTIVAPIPAPIVGQIFTFEGINYFVTKATTPYEVQVFFNRNFSGVAVIPASVDYLGNSFAVKSIVNGAFDGSSLTSVTIPTSISSIRRTVFYNCRSLHTVNLPNTITTIGEEAFDSCSALQSITIPDAVTSIGYNAFTLSGITSINIPKAVTSLGFGAFSWCSSLTSITVKWDTPLAVDTPLFNGLVIGNITLNVPIGTKAAYQAAEVWKDFNPILEIVPAPVLGQTFTVNGINYVVSKATTPYEVAVGTHTGFVGAANIPATVNFAGNTFTVKSISYLAFDQNEGLTAVTIPNTVTQISDEAFFACANLTTATLGTGVTSIGANAFGGCKLTTIDIPSSVISIGEFAFQNNATLSSVKVNWANPITIGADVFTNIALANVILYVPAGTVAVYDTVADNVWTNFNPILEPCITPTAPTAVAQSLCNGATVANLVATGTGTIKWYSLATAGSALASTTALTTGTYYASQTTTCESVSRTAVVVTINAIPTEPTATAQNFTTASTVANLVPPPSASINWYDAATAENPIDPTAAIVSGTLFVSETNANGCESARTAVEVTVNTTVPPVLNDTFTVNGINYLIIKDTKPYEVVVTATPDYNGTAEIPAEVTNNGNSFAVTAIGVNAFNNASGLTGVSIPNSVIRIATNAFNNCTNLGAVVVPDSVISIGNYAFTSCTALASIEMSDALQSIGDGAFDSCTSLSTISLPATLTSIGEAAFAGCTGLTAVTVAATTPLVINADVFLSVNLGSVRLNVPAGSYAAYQAAAVWQNFSPIAEPAPPVVGESFTSNGLNYTITSATAPYTAEVANNSFFVGAAAIPATVALAGNTFAVTSIATNAFQNCNGLTAVIIPNSVTSMGIGAFERCTNLVSVSLPTSLTTISSYAFSYCERLTTINIPSSITTIEANAFRECSGLIAISLPNSITSIGHGAFQLCYNLVTVNIPNTLTRLEDYLFESCIALQSIVIPNTVTNIGAYSLKNTRLTEIIIPSSVTRIENSALAENYNLTTLNIPSSVTRIDDLAFSSCEGLRSITVNWSTPVDVVRRVFTFIPIATVVLNVPSGTRAAYAAATVWSEFIITEPTTNVTTPPTAVAQTFCNTASVSNLVATGTNLKWYDVANAGTALLITDAVVSGTYYVSQTITGVESARTSVAIMVNTTAAPTASNQSLSIGATVAQLVATGTNLNWYSAAIGGKPLVPSTTVTNGAYYVSETINGCESDRSMITVSLITTLNYCRGAVAQPLAAPFAPGTTVRWYTVATGGTALAAAPTPLTTTVGTKLWYVASVISGVESARETITVNTVALPVAPSIITGTASVGVLVGSNTTATYSTANVVGAVSYLWTVPSGVQIEAGQGTNTVTLNFINVSNQPGTIGNISVAAVNASGCAGSTRAFSLRSAIPIAPISLRMMDQTALDPSRAITYISTFIGTNKVLTLTAAPSATASSYLWELAAGMTQLSGGNTNTITVNFAGVNTGVTSLYIGVKSVNGVGISSTANSTQNPATLSTARLLKLSATLLTATPTVTGQTAGLCGGVTYNYTTTAVALANRYQITAPTGAVVRSASNMSNNSNTLSTSDLIFTVTYPAGFVATTALPATLEVRPANGVGTGSKSRILNLSTAMPTFKTPTGSAGITTFTTTTAQTFTVAEIVGTTNYNWTVANGAVIVSGQGTNTITVNFAAIAVAITSTRITVVAANSCGVANTVRTLTLRKVTPPAARFAAAPIAINTTEVYPNPIVNDFNIDVIASKMGMLEMSIYTLDGVLVRKPKIVALAEGENHITENVANFPTGVYIIQLVNSSSNEVTTKKLIKQ